MDGSQPPAAQADGSQPPAAQTEVYHFSDNDAADTETIITSGEFISMPDMLTVASELTDLNLNFKSFPSLPVFAPVRLSAVHDIKRSSVAIFG